MFRFSISNAFRRKGIAIFAILGTALGIALMTVLLSISDGMDDMMTETMTDLAGGIGVYHADALVGYMFGSEKGLPESYADEIEDIAHVEKVLPTVLTLVPTPKEGDVYGADFGDMIGIQMKGLDPAAGDPVEPGDVTEGTYITGPNDVILGSFTAAFAQGQGLEKAELGSTFTMRKAGGGDVEFTLVGVFETDNMYLDSALYGDIDTVRTLVGIPAGEVNYIEVRADSTENAAEVSEAIVAAFADTDNPVSTVVATDMIGEINESMDIFHSFLWVISLVAAIAGGVSIFIVMLISVIERTKEFGILKASGWSNTNIIGSVVMQSVTIGLLGAMVGLAAGYGVGQGIDSYLTIDIALVTWRLVLIIAAFGVLVGIIGGLYPAVRAARVSPIESLRAI